MRRSRRANDAGGQANTLHILHPLIARAQVHLDGIQIDLLADRIAEALLPGSRTIEDAPGDAPPDPSTASDADGAGRAIRLTVTAALKRAGMEMRFVIANVDEGAPYAARLMRLNYLSPDIVVAILNGRQPVGLMARRVMADARLPLEWSAQRVALGLA